MRNCCSFLSAIVAVLTALSLGWYFSQEVPEGLQRDQVQGLRFCGVLLKICIILGRIAYLLGVGEPIKNSRVLMELGSRASAKEEPSLHIQDRIIANVPVRIYRPRDFESQDKKLTGLVYFHGGGWIYGGVESYHPVTQRIAKETHVALVSVDYRLAPQHTFPAHYDDCLAVVKTLLATGEQYGIDTNRIVIGGDSAGGNLAAAVAIGLKNEKKKPAAQILIYPVLQFMDLNLVSYKTAESPTLTKKMVAKFWSIYLTGTDSMVSTFLGNNHSLHLQNATYASYFGAVVTSQENIQTKRSSTLPQVVLDALTDFKASPLMADDLRGLPSTMMITATFDVLRDEALLYMARLRDAGVKVAHYNYNTYHGYLVQATGIFESNILRNTLVHIGEYLTQV